MNAIGIICKQAGVSPIDPAKIDQKKQAEITQLYDLAFIKESQEKLKAELKSLPKSFISWAKMEIDRDYFMSTIPSDKLPLELFIEKLRQGIKIGKFNSKQKKAALFLANKLQAILSLIPAKSKTAALSALLKNPNYDLIAKVEENILLAFESAKKDYCKNKPCPPFLTNSKSINNKIAELCQQGHDPLYLPIEPVFPKR